MYSSTTARRMAAFRSSNIWQSSVPSAKWAGGWLTPVSVVEPEGADEGLLGHLDPADRLHPLLALLLAFQQLALAGDVAAVALGEDVLALGLDGLAGDDPAADGGLDGHVEELPGDQLAQLLGHAAPVVLRLLPVEDGAEGVGRDAVEQHVDPHQVGRLVPGRLVVEAGVPLGARLELVEEVAHDLGERIADGLSTSTTEPSARCTRYATDGAVATRLRSNSRSSRSRMISMCSRPRNPQRKPKPRAPEVSGS